MILGLMTEDDDGVVSVEGNMINSLDDSNPTQLLLRAIDRNAIPSTIKFAEDEQFVLGLLNAEGNVSCFYFILGSAGTK